MIVVEVHIPALDKYYDFSIDEKSKISIIVDEVVEMIGKKEQKTVDYSGSFLLCCLDTGKVLSPEKTAEENCIRAGFKLQLI